MKFLSSIIIICCLLSCNSEIKYPEGGYDYPKASEVTDTTFYFYPLQKTLSRKDSFAFADAYDYFRILDEPNLSIASLGKDIFRLMVDYGVKGHHTFITLTEKEITVKQGNPANYYFRHDSLLTEIESLHYRFLEFYYPFDDTTRRMSTKRRKFLDSLIVLYPELLNPQYYKSLLKKAAVPIPNQSPIAYTTRKIKISKAEFLNLVNQINNSGYWSFPLSVDCYTPSTDGTGITLEANTKRKYNLVTVSVCKNEAEKLLQACQQLVNKAGLKEDIELVLDTSKHRTPVIIQIDSNATLKEVKK